MKRSCASSMLLSSQWRQCRHSESCTDCRFLTAEDVVAMVFSQPVRGAIAGRWSAFFCSKDFGRIHHFHIGLIGAADEIMSVISSTGLMLGMVT